jgi:hypothetical protein
MLRLDAQVLLHHRRMLFEWIVIAHVIYIYQRVTYFKICLLLHQFAVSCSFLRAFCSLNVA